jgi:hypothetical protein
MANYELILGIIGTFTGIASLVWLIIKDLTKERAKLEVEYFTYHLQPPEEYNGISGLLHSDVLIHNKGNKNTSINKIYFTYNDLLLEVEDRRVSRLFPIPMGANSSEKHKFIIDLSQEKVNKIREKRIGKFCIHIIHTYGKVNKYKIIGKELK